MNLTRRRGGRSTFAALASGLALAVLAACGREASVGPVSPELPDNPVIPPQYRGAAFIMDVSTLKKTVRVTPPQGTIRNPIATGLAAGTTFGIPVPRGLSNPANGGTDETFASLLGGDVIDLVATNFQAGALGAVVPNKILITVDLQVVNKLNSVNLIAPTFPTPPAGSTGVLAFPFEISVTTTSGGASVGGAGNEVIITSPRGGAVQVSNDWDGSGAPGSGAPHNFFNDVGCGANSNDCFRWEEYGAIPALGSSTSRTVGWLIDPTVGDFRTKVILAADLQNSGGAAQFGTIDGTVTSPQIGAITGASITISGGFSGTTGAGGAYSVTNVGVGSRTVSVGNLPGGCTAPAAQNVTVTNGGTTTANFSVTCTTPTGTVNGTINNSQGGVISGALVTLTPTGGSAQTFTTGAPGQYTFTVAVGAGTGAITLGSLPANCTNPGSTPYSGLTSGGTVTVNITVTCTAPPQVGTVTGTISSSAGGPISGASVAIGALNVNTNASGVYTLTNVPVPSGTVNATASGCTANSAPYSGLTSGGTVTVNITLTCAAAAHTYPMAIQWGNITTGGPTGRQVQAFLSIDMGGAPGLPNVNGSAADELVGIQFDLSFQSTLLTYASKLTQDANLDLTTAGSSTPGIVTVGVTSSSNATSQGNIVLIRLTFNIPAGAAGTVTPTISFTEILAGAFASPVNVTGTGRALGLATLSIP
jgi:hypothetical protein